MQAVILFLAGFLLMVKGGNVFVDSSVDIAEKMGIPKFIVGATVVSMATTLPEFMVSLIAVFKGSSQMGIGNAIGSVSCNMGIAFAVIILFSKIHISMKDYAAKGAIMVCSVILLIMFSFDGVLTKGEAIAMLILLGLFFWINIDSASKGIRQIKKQEKRHIRFKTVLFFVLGALAVTAGARLIVSSGTDIAYMLNVPETVIGITLMALGTSLPEIATAVISAVKKESGISAGNIVGANIIDITLILPVCALLLNNGFCVDMESIFIHMPAALILCIIGVLPVFVGGGFKKWQGFALIGVYAGYIAAVVTRAV